MVIRINILRNQQFSQIRFDLKLIIIFLCLMWANILLTNNLKKSDIKYISLIATSSKTLKALDTFGNCQNPLFSIGVSQHMHKIIIIIIIIIIITFI